MRPIEEIQKDLARLTEYADNKQYPEFVDLATDINEEMFKCLSLMTHTFPTIEKVSSMKVTALKSAVFPTLVGISFFFLLLMGANYIENPNIRDIVNVIIVLFAGPYLWNKVKEGLTFYSNIKKVSNHENELITNLGYYLDVARLLKPVYEYANTQIQQWEIDGEYTIEDNQPEEYPVMSEEEVRKVYDDIIKDIKHSFQIDDMKE